MCFFGYLRSREIVVPSDMSFEASSHLAHGDVIVDNTGRPHYLELMIKACKTDPFKNGVSVFIHATGRDVYPVAAILSYIILWGQEAGPFFNFANGNVLTQDRFVSAVRSALESAGYCLSPMRVTASASGQPPQQFNAASQTPSSRHWAVGRVPHIRYTSGHPLLSVMTAGPASLRTLTDLCVMCL